MTTSSEKTAGEELVAVPRSLLGAACAAIRGKRDAPNTLSQLNRYAVHGPALAKPASSPAGGRVWTVKGWLPNGDGCEFTFGDESEYLRFMASKPATFDVSDIEELVVSSCGRAHLCREGRMSTALEARWLEAIAPLSPRFIDSEGKWAVAYENEFEREIERFDTHDEAKAFCSALSTSAGRVGE